MIGGAEAVVAAVDPERNNTAIVSRWFYTGMSATAVDNFISAHNARIVDIEVEVESSTPTFSVSFISNSGSYARTQWWYPALTAAQLSSNLTTNNARLIDINPYTVPGVAGRRFAVVMVLNTDAALKTWWYYYDASVAGLNTQATNNNARLIDLASYSVSGVAKYAGIMISNTGVDVSTSWWYPAVTPAQIGSYVSTNSARIIDLERNPSGSWSALMVPVVDPVHNYWFTDQTLSTLVGQITQLGQRVTSFSRYTTASGTRYAYSFINDLDPESDRVRVTAGTAFNGGAFGFYVKRIGSSKVLGLQEGNVFEPASAIKALHFTYELSKVQAASDSLTRAFDFYRHPVTTSDGPGVCPDTSAETSSYRIRTTVQTGLFGMMRDSDNRMTRGFELRLSRTGLNNYAASLGMSSTKLAQIIGCGFDNGLKNNLTLTDIGKLYDGVSRSVTLTGSARASFYSLIDNGAAWSALQSMITSEASNMGKGAIAQEFIDNVHWWSKGGSYDICGAGGCGAAPYTWIRTDAGQLDLPFKSASVITPRPFAFGRYVTLVINCAQNASTCTQRTNAGNASSTLRTEIWRAQVKAALATW
jgi:hypothetical protein